MDHHHSFPMFKLVGLLIRQMASPVASRIKEYAKVHPQFRKTICYPIAKFHSHCELRFKMWMLRLGKPVHFPKISERQAIDLGGNILGEAIVFGIVGTVITLEVMRQANNQELKVQEEENEWQAVISSANNLKEILVKQQKEMDVLFDKLSDEYEKLIAEKGQSDDKDIAIANKQTL